MERSRGSRGTGIPLAAIVRDGRLRSDDSANATLPGTLYGPNRQARWRHLARGGSRRKPFVLLVLLVPLLRRSWGQLAAAIGTLVIMTAIGLAIAGPTAFVDYVRESPIVRTPGSVLTESNNVPVVAYFLRAAHVMPPNAASLPPSLVALNLSLLLIGVSVAALVARRNAVLAFCAVLTLALLVYPQSNIHYAQLLALPLLALWRDPVFERRPLAMATLICGAYALLSVAGGADTMFATLLVWVICLATSLRGEPSVSLWRKKSGLPARCEPVFP